jgi:hypothetical protein
MGELCEQEEWGDPYSYARSKEIRLAIELDHRVAETLSGADAYDENGNPVEYKSTIGKNISAAYSGISVKPSWEEQVKYLREEKIGKYKHHFIARFCGPKIAEVWRLTGKDVCDILERKLRGKTPRGADPRLSAGVCMTEIKKFGTQIV